MSESVDDYDGPGTEPLPDAADDPASVLAHLVPALWRTMRRGSRAAAELPANESQVTILRMLDLHGSLTPTRLAELLGLAKPTVSNQLRALAARGLINRTSSDSGDARMAAVSATPTGRLALEAFRRDRANLLRQAMARLSEAEKTQIPSSVAALRHLLRHLEAVVSERQDGQ